MKLMLARSPNLILAKPEVLVTQGTYRQGRTGLRGPDGWLPHQSSSRLSGLVCSERTFNVKGSLLGAELPLYTGNYTLSFQIDAKFVNNPLTCLITPPVSFSRCLEALLGRPPSVLLYVFALLILFLIIVSIAHKAVQSRAGQRQYDVDDQRDDNRDNK